jgi:hypothetical protein
LSSENANGPLARAVRPALRRPRRDRLLPLRLDPRLPARVELDLLRRPAGGRARRNEAQMLMHVFPPFVHSQTKMSRQKPCLKKHLKIRSQNDESDP